MAKATVKTDAKSGSKKVKTSPKKSNTLKDKLADCDSLIEVLREMTIVADKFKATGNVTFHDILESFAKKICDIHNRQAVFNDALKRALKMLVKRLDTADALTSTLAAYVEAGVSKPYTFDETKGFEEFISAIDKFSGKQSK